MVQQFEGSASTGGEAEAGAGQHAQVPAQPWGCVVM